MDTQFCAKALDAARNAISKTLPYSCAVANDNPATPAEETKPCTSASKHRTRQTGQERARDDPEKPSTPIEAAPSSAALDKAKAAYDSNNFDRARTIFEHADPTPKPPPPIIRQNFPLH